MAKGIDGEKEPHQKNLMDGLRDIGMGMLMIVVALYTFYKWVLE